MMKRKDLIIRLKLVVIISHIFILLAVGMVTIIRKNLSKKHHMSIALIVSTATDIKKILRKRLHISIARAANTATTILAKHALIMNTPGHLSFQPYH
jgi:hypothetical protein